MSDLQADIVTQAGTTLVAFDKINAKMIQLERSTRNVNRAMKDTQATAARVGGVTLGRGAQMVGRSISQAGGGVIGRVFGGFGLDGNFGRIAVGLGVVAASFRMLASASDAAVDRVRKRIEAERQYADAIERGRGVLQQQARAGLDRAPSRLALLSAGGESAVQQADRLEATGLLSGSEARSVTATAFNRMGDTRRTRSALSMIEELASVGMPASQAAEKVFALRGQLDDPTKAVAARERIYRGFTKGTGSFAEARRRGFDSGDALITRHREDAEIRQKIGPLQEQAAIADQGASARAELGRAANPVMAEVGELHKAVSRKIDAMNEMAEAEWDIIRRMRDVGVILGGQGSQRYQTSREATETFGGMK